METDESVEVTIIPNMDDSGESDNEIGQEESDFIDVKYCEND